MRPHRRLPTRLPCPWDYPGKNTGVGCHFLLQCIKVKSESEVAQSCLTLSDLIDCSLPGSSAVGFSRQEYWSRLPLPSPNLLLHKHYFKIQFGSVVQTHLTLWDSMDCSTPGFPVHHQLPNLAQTHVHRVGNVIQPSHPLLSPSAPSFSHS